MYLCIYFACVVIVTVMESVIKLWRISFIYNICYFHERKGAPARKEIASDKTACLCQCSELEKGSKFKTMEMKFWGLHFWSKTEYSLSQTTKNTLIPFANESEAILDQSSQGVLKGQCVRFSNFLWWESLPQTNITHGYGYHCNIETSKCIVASW